MQRKRNTTTTKLKPKTKRVGVSNKVELDAKNPIPFEHGQTSFSYINDSRYLKFLPEEDNMGQNLLEARLLSVTHNACVTTKKDYCAGEGFQDLKGKDIDKNILEWFRCMNLRSQSVVNLNKKIFEAFFTLGNVPIELVKFTVAKKNYLYIYVHNMLEWRLGYPDDDDNVNEAIQSKLFTKRSLHLTRDQIKKLKKIPIYNPLKSEKDNWVKDEKGAYRTLIWYKNEVTGFPYYGLPSAVSSMIHQILEYKGARYNLDNFDNNMVPSAILALKGNYSEAEASKIAKKIVAQHSGDGRRGRVIVLANEEGLEDTNFHKLENQTDGSFTQADNGWTQKIILANQWDAVLSGLVNPSTLGKGAGFITKILENKLKTVIIPAQQDLMNEVWSHIFKIATEWLKLPFDNYELAIKNSIDISGLTDVDITPAVQINEVRKAKGLPEDPGKNGVYMKSSAPTAQPNEEEEGGEGNV
jgi:hypothetical protein